MERISTTLKLLYYVHLHNNHTEKPSHCHYKGVRDVRIIYELFVTRSCIVDVTQTV